MSAARSHGRPPAWAWVAACGLAAAACALANAGGSSPAPATSAISLLGVAALVLAQFAFVHERFGAACAVLAALASACSPLLLASARSGSADAPAAAAQLCAAWLFLETPERRVRGRTWSFAFAFAVALALRPCSFAWLAPFGAGTLASRSRGAPRRLAIATVLALGIVGIPWLAGWSSLLANLDEPHAAAHVELATWYRVVIDVWLCSPAIALPATCLLGAAAWLSARGERDPVREHLAACVVAGFAALAFTGHGLRDAVALDALLRALLLSLGISALGAVASTARRALAVAMLSAACAGDLASYRELFLAGGLTNPTTQQLLEARRMLPVIPDR